MSAHIPIEDCVDGYVYKIKARNGSFGVYKEKDKAFTLSRHKFDQNYLFDEYHWDTGEPFGTAQPLEDLGPAPKHDNEKDRIAWLNGLTESEKDEQ